MGRTNKPKQAASGGKSKQPASGAAKSKPSKSESKSSGGGKLGTCNFVKARHILCEKLGKIEDAYNKLKTEYLDSSQPVPPAKFGEVAMQYSECSSAKSGGSLGWFPRGKMEGKFQEVAFGLAVGEMSGIFKGSNGYHIVLCEGRRA